MVKLSAQYLNIYISTQYFIHGMLGCHCFSTLCARATYTVRLPLPSGFPHKDASSQEISIHSVWAFIAPTKIISPQSLSSFCLFPNGLLFPHFPSFHFHFLPALVQEAWTAVKLACGPQVSNSEQCALLHFTHRCSLQH